MVARLKKTRYRSKETIKLDDLGSVNRKFLIEEVQSFATQVALQENAYQAKLNPENLANRIIFDRRTAYDLSPTQARKLAAQSTDGNVIFADFKANVRFSYQSIRDISQAVQQAYSLLVRLTPKGNSSNKSAAWNHRHSVDTYYFYLLDPENPGRNGVVRSQGGTVPGQVTKFLADSTHEGISVRILGPLTEYRRSVIYRGTNRPKRGVTKWGRQKTDSKLYRSSIRQNDKIRFPGNRKTTRLQVLQQTAINEIVVRRMRNRFRDAYFGYRFIKSREPLELYNSPTWTPTGENIHIPQIYIGVKDLSRYGRRSRGR